MTRDKEVHYKMIKESIPQADIMILNSYAPNDRASKYTEQKLKKLKGETDNSTIIVRDFNPLVSYWFSQRVSQFPRTSPLNRHRLENHHLQSYSSSRSL